MKRLLLLLLLAGCTREAPVERTPQEPVVVYAAYGEDAALAALFGQYRAETGVVVINRHGEPRAIVDDLIRDDTVPPADVLMTRSAVDAWRASEESALRPVYSDVILERVPSWARDADNLWFATSADVAVVAFDPSRHGGEDMPSFAELAQPDYAGQLCLPSSNTAISRAVIALLIAGSSVREAELTVRAWQQNLAAPPFSSQEELVAAVTDGRCGVGIVSESSARNARGLDYYHPNPTIATIDAAGIGRHARNPEGAARFVEWLIRELPPIDTGDSALQGAAIPALYDEAARLLAERARYY